MRVYPGDRVTTQHLYGRVAELTDLSFDEAREAVLATFDAVVEHLVEGRSVNVGNFGTMYPVTISASANPQTGTLERIQVKTVRLKTSATLRAALVAGEAYSIRKQPKGEPRG